MNPDVANLRKRKLFSGVAVELGLPAPKHKCCEAVVDSECDLVPLKSPSAGDVCTWIDNGSVVTDDMDTQVESAQSSNSFPGESQSGSAEGKLDRGSRNTDSYYEASTSWADSGSGRSRNGSFYAGNRMVSDMNNGKEEKHCPHQGTEWHDIDCLEECISAEYCKDSNEQTRDKFDEFLAASGVDPNLFVPSPERLSAGQEAQPGSHKPTIDQEFEQYFSMLIL